MAGFGASEFVTVAITLLHVTSISATTEPHPRHSRAHRPPAGTVRQRTLPLHHDVLRTGKTDSLAGAAAWHGSKNSHHSSRRNGSRNSISGSDSSNSYMNTSSRASRGDAKAVAHASAIQSVTSSSHAPATTRDAPVTAVRQLLVESSSAKLEIGLQQHPLVKLLTTVRSIGPVAACNVDPTLPHGPLDRNKKYLFAIDLSNSAKIMPQLITQLIPALLLFRRKKIYVSVYESGSFDSTREWLQLLEKLLTSLKVGHSITVAGESRGRGQERIKFLARVRNLAMKPLYDATFDADRVVFINDVAFCAQDITRLVQHDAHFVCGVDLWNWAGLAVPSSPDFQALQGMIPPTILPIPKRVRLYLNNKWQQRQGEDRGPLPRQLQFYDNWVAHDIDGQRFRVEYPYTTVNASRERSVQGLPFAVQCCWNGMAVFDAAPLKGGLRFRSNIEGECYQSECSLLCDDFWRLGYTKIVVDPSVRVTYCPSMYPHLHVPERPSATWQQVMDAPPINWTDVRPPVVTDCCEGGTWDLCRHHFRWMDKNYTDMAFKSNFAPSNICYKYKDGGCTPPQ